MMMFHMQFTYKLKLTVCLSLLHIFFLFLSKHLLKRVLLHCTSSPLFTFAIERILLFILSIISVCLTKLTFHYLMKQSSLDKQGLSIYTCQTQHCY